MIYLLAVITSFFIGMIIAPAIIWAAKRLKVGQTVLSYVEQHKQKQGVPTMGGWIFIIAATATALIYGGVEKRFLIFCVLVMLGYGIIGFTDDFLKVVLKRNMGLHAYQKIISQFMLALIATYFAYKNMYVGSNVFIPYWGEVDFKWWYFPFSVFIYTAVTNSVNLTDGLDGLAGTTSTVYFSIILVAVFLAANSASDAGMTFYAGELESLIIVICSTLGAMGAFLWFNSYKAKIIMGDTGSMALGGLISAVSMLVKTPHLLVFAGIMYVVSSISVILQVVSFKLRKKRIFLMSPFHHHLELKGLNESKIVTFYSIVTLIGGIVGIIFIL